MMAMSHKDFHVLAQFATGYIVLRLQGSPSPSLRHELAQVGRAAGPERSLNLLLELERYQGWDPYDVAHVVWRHAGASPELSALIIVCGPDILQRFALEVGRPLFSGVRVFAKSERAEAARSAAKSVFSPSARMPVLR